jgi:hypothetical protein
MRRLFSARAQALLGAVFASLFMAFIAPRAAADPLAFYEIQFAPGTPPYWRIPAYHYNFGPPLGQRRVPVPQIFKSSPPVEIEKIPYRPGPAAPPGRQTVCVRACDGYYFPLSTLRKESDAATQQARCSTLCPGAASRLFVLTGRSSRIEDATAAGGGGSYAKLLASLGKIDVKEAVCSCQAGAEDPLRPGSALLDDRTLRPGDAVVTPTGVRILQAGRRYPYRATDFSPLRTASGLALSARRALSVIDRALAPPREDARPREGADWKSAAE